MCAPKLKHMSKLIPESAPKWLHEACGNAVWCKVSNGGIFDCYAWIVPIYDWDSSLPFIDSEQNHWAFAEPVTDEETLRETEGMR